MNFTGSLPLCGREPVLLSAPPLPSSGNRPGLRVIFAPVTKISLLLSPETPPRLPRRAFLRYAGAASAGAALLLTGCSTDDDPAPTTTVTATGESISLGGTTDAALMNMLQAGKQIMVAFYKKLLDTPPSWLTGTDLAVVQQLSAHQDIHRNFLKSAVASLRTSTTTINYLGTLSTDLTAVSTADRTTTLTTALSLHNVLASAANGAARYTGRDTLLTLLGQLTSVDSRHATALAGLLGVSPFDSLTDSRTIARKPTEAIAVLNTYLAFGSRLLSGSLA
jgi:Ferritin-like domain